MANTSVGNTSAQRRRLTPTAFHMQSEESYTLRWCWKCKWHSAMEEWGPVLCRNSIVHHRAVHVSHNIVVEPWAGAFSRMKTLTSWDARPGTLKEISSDTLCSGLDRTHQGQKYSKASSFNVRIQRAREEDHKTKRATLLDEQRHGFAQRGPQPFNVRSHGVCDP